MDILIHKDKISDLYGIQNPNADQLVYCKQNNSIYHLKDRSRSNKSDGWEITSGASSTTVSVSSGSIPTGVYLTAAQSDIRYVKYQSEYTLIPSLAPDQVIYGNIILHGNFSATGEVSAFQGSINSNWWSSMPVATATTLGGIKIGANLTIDSNGVLNANAGGGGGSGLWGGIGGALADQTDLVNALALKANLNSPTFTGLVSGITAAMVGLDNVTNNAQWHATNHPTTVDGYGITDGAKIFSSGVENQVAIWKDASSLSSSIGLVYDGLTLYVTGNVSATGEVSAFQGAAPINWWDSMPAPTTTTRGGILLGIGTTKFLCENGTWQEVSGGGGGTTNHSALSNLDYASAGHTGFAQTVHNLIDSTNHPVSGLTAGHFLKATSATTYSFTTHGLTYTDVNACANDDVRLSNSRSASDVYAWAKASVKPSYSLAELGAAAASHTHSTYDNHLANTANPHSTTAAQLNLGNVTNESKATMFTSPVFTGNPRVALVTGNTGLIFSLNGTDGLTITENHIGIRVNADLYINNYTGGNGNVHLGKTSVGTITVENIMTVVGMLNISAIKTANYTLTEEGGIFYLKYGSTKIASWDSSGFFKAKDEVGAFETI